MNCRDCELRIADGDFDRTIEDHLRECAECCALLGDLRENTVAMAAMREEEMPVRPRRSRSPGPHIWIPAAVAAALALLAIALPEHREQVAKARPVTPVAASSPTPALTIASLASAPVVRRVGRRKVTSMPVQSDETLMVKMLTPDPDVVIYWIVEPKEKSE